MLGRLNHVAIAVRDLAAAAAVYRDTLGRTCLPPQQLPEHGVTVVFVTLANTKIELLEPLGAHSPIAKFLEKSPDGGMHHVCYEVDDIIAARDRLKAQRCARAGRWHPEDRRARQARAVPAPQGFLRHAGRAGAGLDGGAQGRHCVFDRARYAGLFARSGVRSATHGLHEKLYERIGLARIDHTRDAHGRRH